MALAEMEVETARGVNQLEQLRKFSRIVADTGDFEKIKEYAPVDATTNPTLILKAVQKPDYQALLERAIIEAHTISSAPSYISRHLLVEFGVEILKIVPGRVSTETSARLAFDTEALIQEARLFISLYEGHGVSRERILIKLASTWEGIRAAEILEREGIHCNMTLLFSLVQAAACAEAGATLISPFVGRILDWHKAKYGRDYSPAEDPGVKSVVEIYAYFKKFDYPTQIMGASFRSKGEVLELAGCDLLTISPELLAELKHSYEPVERKLNPSLGLQCQSPRMIPSEKEFRWLLNENLMATEKLAEGIVLFARDADKLEDMIARAAVTGVA